MKETYETPSVEIVLLNFSDVITASGGFRPLNPAPEDPDEAGLVPFN